jgi:hypothetical protein
MVVALAAHCVQQGKQHTDAVALLILRYCTASGMTPRDECRLHTSSQLAGCSRHYERHWLGG